MLKALKRVFYRVLKKCVEVVAPLSSADYFIKCILFGILSALWVFSW